jgi:hypothetical protein
MTTDVKTKPLPLYLSDFVQEHGQGHLFAIMAAAELEKWYLYAHELKQALEATMEQTGVELPAAKAIIEKMEKHDVQVAV